MIGWATRGCRSAVVSDSQTALFTVCISPPWGCCEVKSMNFVLWRNCPLTDFTSPLRHFILAPGLMTTSHQAVAGHPYLGLLVENLTLAFGMFGLKEANYKARLHYRTASHCVCFASSSVWIKGSACRIIVTMNLNSQNESSHLSCGFSHRSHCLSPLEKWDVSLARSTFD